MVRIERFEDIEAWKIARKLTSGIYGLASWPKLAKDFGLRDQMQRASVSIMANIAEGFDGRSTKEFIRFLGYAYRSATELQSHLYVALDQSYLTQGQFDNLYDQIGQVKKMINGFIRYLKEVKRRPLVFSNHEP